MRRVLHWDLVKWHDMRIWRSDTWGDENVHMRGDTNNNRSPRRPDANAAGDIGGRLEAAGAGLRGGVGGGGGAPPSARGLDRAPAHPAAQCGRLPDA